MAIPVSHMLEDPHPRVRSAATLALARIGDATALPALERAARADPGNPQILRALEDLAAQDG